MGKGCFLVNPELNVDDVTVTASSQLGGRPGQPFPCGETNSGLIAIAASGNPGDDENPQPHDFTILGGQKRPRYVVYDEAGNELKCTPNTIFPSGWMGIAFGQAGTQARYASVVADDRLFVIHALAAGGELTVNCWDGSAWAAKAAYADPGLTDCAALAVAAIGQNVYIVVANNTDKTIECYVYNTLSATIGLVDEAIVATNGNVTSLALASNGATFVLAITRGATTRDVEIWYGGVGDLTERDKTINQTFYSTWSTGGTVVNNVVTGGDVRSAGLAYNKNYGFVLAVRCGTTGINGSYPRKICVATSPDGDRWKEYKNIDGVVDHPSAADTSFFSNVDRIAVTVENWRVFLWYTIAATVDTNPTALVLRVYQPRNEGPGWSEEATVPGTSPGIDTGTWVAAANWRGTMWFFWSSGGALKVQRCNVLDTSGIWPRELLMGEPNFVAGKNDDSGTALWFTPSGTIRAGDRFRIPAEDYDYAVVHVLDDLLARVWRADAQAGAPSRHATFDAGSNRAFTVDALAIFGSNLPTITFEVSESPEPQNSPIVSQLVSAVVQSAVIMSADRNRIVFADDTFEPHVYAQGVARYWVRMGALAYRVLDNDDRSLTVDGDASGVGGEAQIFRNSMGYFFDQVYGPARYVHIITPEQPAIPPPEEGYYEIARVVFGLRFAPPIDYRREWRRRVSQQAGRVEFRDGARYNTNLNPIQRPAWTLTYRHYAENVKPIENFFGRVGGSTQLFAFWPNPTAETGDQPEVYPMFFTQDAPETTDLGAGATELAVVIEGQI